MVPKRAGLVALCLVALCVLAGAGFWFDDSVAPGALDNLVQSDGDAPGGFSGLGFTEGSGGGFGEGPIPTQFGRVHDDSPEGSGAEEGVLPREVIREVVRSRVPSVQGCYERALEDEPTLQGRVELNFTIGLDGRVVRAVVERNDTGSAAFGECVRLETLAMEFPPPSGGLVVVRYPFIFRQP